jgi:sporulation protein YabP
LAEFETSGITHKIEIVQREEIRLQGVIHVESFDEHQVVVETDLGIVALSGEDFHITSLDLDKGLMIIEGMINGLEYSPLDRSRRQKDKGFLQRLFR